MKREKIKGCIFEIIKNQIKSNCLECTLTSELDYFVADLGMDSLDISEIIIDVEEKFNIDMEFGLALNQVKDLIDIIKVE